MAKARQFQIATLTVYLALGGVMLALSLHAAGGLFYTLDDPYIHLAVAENINRGVYGVNLEEPSSPSSSIAYPWILALALRLGLGDWGPLVIGVAALAGVAWILAGWYWRYAVDPAAPSHLATFILAPVALLLALNALALPFTGMEHPLHVLGVALTVTGLAALREPGPPLALVAGILICATIRFEGLALAGLGVLALFRGRRPGWGLVAAAAAAGILVAWGAYMARLGLPLLPSSVLSKSTASAALSDSDGLGFLRQTIDTLRDAVDNRWGLVFALTSLLCLFAAAGAFGPTSTERTETARRVGLVVALALLAHLAFGRYGWFGRYEVYGTAAAILALLLVFSRGLRAIAARRPFGPLVAPALLLLVAAPYHFTTLVTPLGGRAVRDQQYQMHRFATDFFPGTVAVNDLGWVAYENDGFVLDLWGLGSERARRVMAAPDTDADDVAALAADHHAAYAMLYPEYFAGRLPTDWCDEATLSSAPVSAASGEVRFFLIDRAREAEFRAALAAFAEALPEGDALAQRPCRDAPAAAAADAGLRPAP